MNFIVKILSDEKIFDAINNRAMENRARYKIPRITGVYSPSSSNFMAKKVWENGIA